MKHLGDITRINGAEIEPVDVITGGSPCQDLSVAGKRVGLVGERSGLFMEQIRIIKEMRNATNNLFPRYAVWENVPGAFSSNKGEDFRAVLEEFCKVVDEDAVIPESPGGKWRTAGVIMGDGYSIAWRVFDAQYFGVPHRRRRIALVADFRGESAPEILFESEGLSGYSKESFRTWQGTAGCFENGIRETGTSSVILNDQGGNRMDVTEDVTCTLRAEAHHPPCILEEAVAVENHPMDGRVKLEENGKVQTLSERMGTGGNNVPLVMKIRSGCEGGGKGALIQENKSATLSCNNDQTLFEPCGWDGGQVSPTLTKQNAGGNQRMPDKDNFTCVLQPFGICSKDSNAMKSENPHSGIYEAETARTLDGNGGNPSCNQGGIAIVEGNGHAVRRLTPLECSRLQGYPDGWCDIGDWRDDKGKLHKDSDSSKYKALGNSIALPPWRWLLRRMAERLPQGATIGSLFDGIGGFPLIWSEINGIDACKWASEIEPYCIAVTEHRFNIKKPAAGTADKEDSTIIVTHQILIVKGN